MQTIVFYGIGFAAVAFYAVLPAIAKKLEVSIPPFAFIAITMMLLGALALVLSLLFEKQFHFANLGRYELSWLFIFSFINLIGFALFLKAIMSIPVAHYQLIYGALPPLIGAFFAYIWFGEQMTLRFFIAIPFVLAGLAIALLK